MKKISRYEALHIWELMEAIQIVLGDPPPKGCCIRCEHYDDEKKHCKKHGADVPDSEAQKKQTCYESMLPF